MSGENNLMSRMHYENEDVAEYEATEIERLLIESDIIRAKYEKIKDWSTDMEGMMKEYDEVKSLYMILKSESINNTRLTLKDLRKEFDDLLKFDISPGEATPFEIDEDNPVFRRAVLDAQIQTRMCEKLFISEFIAWKDTDAFRLAWEEAYQNFVAGNLKIESNETNLKSFANFLSYLVLEEWEWRWEKLENFKKILVNDSPEILQVFQDNWWEWKVITQNLRDISTIDEKFTLPYQFSILKKPVESIMSTKTREMKANVLDNVRKMRSAQNKDVLQNGRYEEFMNAIEAISDDSTTSISDIQKAIRTILWISDPKKIVQIYTEIVQEKIYDMTSDAIDLLDIVQSRAMITSESYEEMRGAIERVCSLENEADEKDLKTISDFMDKFNYSTDHDMIELVNELFVLMAMYSKVQLWDAAMSNMDAQGIFISKWEQCRADEDVFAAMRPSIENEILKNGLTKKPEANKAIEALGLWVSGIEDVLKDEDVLDEAISRLSSKKDITEEESDILENLQKFQKNRKQEKRQYVIAVNNLSEEQIQEFENKWGSLEEFYDRSKKNYEVKTAKEAWLSFNEPKAEKSLEEARPWDVVQMKSLPSEAMIIKRSDNNFELKLFDKVYEYTKDEIPQIGASIEFIVELWLGFLLQDLRSVEKLFNDNSLKKQVWREGFSFKLSDKNWFSREEKHIFMRTLWQVLFDKQDMDNADSPEKLEQLFRQAHQNNVMGGLVRERGIMGRWWDLKFWILEWLVKWQ